MTIILAGLLAFVAFVVLVRLVWVTVQPRAPTAIITLTAVVLVISLALLTATGRIHWLVAMGAAVAPFLRRALGLVRYLPLLSRLLKRTQGPIGGQPPHRDSGAMSHAKACDVLGLGPHPEKAEVIAAHRRLIQKLHPDRGGTNYLAQQLNEAKRLLLEDHVG